MDLLISAIVLTEAVSAVNGAVVARTERDLGLDAACGAGNVMHLALLIAATAATAVLLFTRGPAFGAASRFVGESFFGEEILFGGGENEFGAAVAAG